MNKPNTELAIFSHRSIYDLAISLRRIHFYALTAHFLNGIFLRPILQVRQRFRIRKEMRRECAAVG